MYANPTCPSPLTEASSPLPAAPDVRPAPENARQARRQRQRALFLWQWSQRRRIGRNGAVLRGLVIGAAGGLVFAVALGLMMGGGGNRSTAALLQVLQQWFLVVGLAVPAFAGLAAATSARVFNANEFMFQQMLQGGDRVPSVAPTLQAGDRGPLIAVVLAVAVIAGLLLALLIAYG